MFFQLWVIFVEEQLTINIEMMIKGIILMVLKVE